MSQSKTEIQKRTPNPKYLPHSHYRSLTSLLTWSWTLGALLLAVSIYTNVHVCFKCRIELGIATQYLQGINRNNSVPSSIETSPVKQYLRLILFVPCLSGFARSQSPQVLFNATCDWPTIVASTTNTVCVVVEPSAVYLAVGSSACQDVTKLLGSNHLDKEEWSWHFHTTDRFHSHDGY